MYTALPFYFSKMLSEAPFEWIFSSIFWSICYWMAGLNPQPDRFFISLVILVLVLYCAQWFGYAFATIFPQLATANLASNVIFTLFVLTSGWAVSSSQLLFQVKSHFLILQISFFFLFPSYHTDQPR
jgi:hypothetical protein